MHVQRSKIGLATTVLLLAFAATARAGADTRFPPDSLRAFVNYLADDRLEGRGPGTAGIELAAQYIAAHFKNAGLEPAGDHDSFLQDFDVTIGVRPAGRNELRMGSKPLAFESDWVAYGFSDTGTTRAALVFAGYGISAPEYSYDDYAGLDAKGKIVLVLRYEPAQNDSASVFEGTVMTAHADLRRKAILARERGAVGMLVVTGPLSQEPDRLAKLQPDVGYYSTGIACGQLRREALLGALAKLDLASMQKQIDSSGKPASRALDAPVEWTVGLEKERTKLHNVLGLLPGRDPHRVVVIGAHYDHLGMGGPSSLEPDAHEPHNGADDNASGTAALLALARWFATGPKPQQTLLFAAFSGEELGLAGSAHYVKQPVYPLEYTTAMLNMDMIGRLRDRRLLVFGTATAEQFPTLLQALNGEGPKFDLRMKGDGYGPSDQMSFFKKNVPVLHFFTGAHSEYHKPTDDASLIEYDGLSEVTGFVADVAKMVMQEPLKFVGATTPPPSSGDGGGSGFRSYLGTVPDYGQDENLQGVLLSGVRAGSPAEKAGIQGGDVIVQIDATVIHNIQDFVYVLRTRQPGENLEITVLRAGKKELKQAVLANRP